MILRDVTKVDFSQRPFRSSPMAGDEPYLADTVIIATGASAQWLGLPSEQRLQGRGVSRLRHLRRLLLQRQESRSSAAATRRWKRRCS